MGLLLAQEQPLSGYSLHRRYATLFIGAERLNVGQLYSTLRRLECDDLAKCVAISSHGNRASKLYSPTRTTHDAVRAWLFDPGLEAHQDWFVATQVKLGVAEVVGIDSAEVWTTQRRALLVARQGHCEIGSAPGREILRHRYVSSIEVRLNWLDIIRRDLP